MTAVSIEDIDAVLPQTQCTKCGYEGCLPYATAVAQGESINRCPPGGQEGIRKLARLLGREELELDRDCGQHQPLSVAVINEEHCIGCTLCIQACPLDAIVGANKWMHTVVDDLCSGCELCVAPCPVDCITMEPAGHEWTAQRAAEARIRHHKRRERLAAKHPETTGLAARTLANKAALSRHALGNEQDKKAVIADALARARARRKRVEA